MSVENEPKNETGRQEICYQFKNPQFLPNQYENQQKF